jgi:hypothetical protein
MLLTFDFCFHRVLCVRTVMNRRWWFSCGPRPFCVSLSRFTLRLAASILRRILRSFSRLSVQRAPCSPRFVPG